MNIISVLTLGRPYISWVMHLRTHMVRHCVHLRSTVYKISPETIVAEMKLGAIGHNNDMLRTKCPPFQEPAHITGFSRKPDGSVHFDERCLRRFVILSIYRFQCSKFRICCAHLSVLPLLGAALEVCGSSWKLSALCRVTLGHPATL